MKKVIIVCIALLCIGVVNAQTTESFVIREINCQAVCVEVLFLNEKPFTGTKSEFVIAAGYTNGLGNPLYQPNKDLFAVLKTVDAKSSESQVYDVYIVLFKNDAGYWEKVTVLEGVPWIEIIDDNEISVYTLQEDIRQVVKIDFTRQILLKAKTNQKVMLWSPTWHVPYMDK